MHALRAPGKAVARSEALPRLSTLKQVQRSVQVFHGAAKALLDAGYPGQAVARAHYAVHALCGHIAEYTRTLPYWPMDFDTGKAAGRYYHSHVPVTVRAVAEARARRGESITVILSPDQAYVAAQRLLAGRMEADYRPYLPVSKEVAAKHILASHTLCEVLNAEAEYLAAQAAAAVRATQQGVPQLGAQGRGDVS